MDKRQGIGDGDALWYAVMGKRAGMRPWGNYGRSGWDGSAGRGSYTARVYLDVSSGALAAVLWRVRLHGLAEWSPGYIGGVLTYGSLDLECLQRD